MKKYFYIISLFLIGYLSGCGYQTREFTSPTNASIVKHIQAYPHTVNPGATVVLNIDLVASSSTFFGGKAIVNDSYGNSYHGTLSHAKKSSGNDLVASITLSPLVPSGELLLHIFVLDTKGNPSNTGFVNITVL